METEKYCHLFNSITFDAVIFCSVAPLRTLKFKSFDVDERARKILSWSAPFPKSNSLELEAVEVG